MLIRIGSNSANATPAPNDMWMVHYNSEIITAYDERVLFDKLLNFKTIEPGQVAKFPATWKMGTEVHEIGTELLGLNTELREYTISLDDRPITSSFELDDIDVKFAHFDTRNEFSRQCGLALGRDSDSNSAKLIIQASRFAQGNATSFPGGGMDGNGLAYKDTNFAAPNAASATPTNALAVISALDAIKVRWDQQDVPDDGGRTCVIGPATFLALRKLGTLVPGITSLAMPVFGHGDIDPLNPSIFKGMNGDTPLMYNGFRIVWSNRIPCTNTTATDLPRYAGNYTDTVGMVFQRDCVAKCNLMGIVTETERSVRRGVDFVVSKMLQGGGTLRPLCAVELSKAA